MSRRKCCVRARVSCGCVSGCSCWSVVVAGFAGGLLRLLLKRQWCLICYFSRDFGFVPISISGADWRAVVCANWWLFIANVVVVRNRNFSWVDVREWFVIFNLMI